MKKKNNKKSGEMSLTLDAIYKVPEGSSLSEFFLEPFIENEKKLNKAETNGKNKDTHNKKKKD
jgi:hypothetical protein